MIYPRLLRLAPQRRVNKGKEQTLSAITVLLNNTDQKIHLGRNDSIYARNASSQCTIKPAIVILIQKTLLNLEMTKWLGTKLRAPCHHLHSRCPISKILNSEVLIEMGETVCRILSLDGGGAKGFYTLGILREVEALLGGKLHDHFDLIFGTSTGSIIASLLALGNNVDTIHQLYCEHIPTIMQKKSAEAKSAALSTVATDVFKEKKFDDVHTSLGVITTRWQFETPMIFKVDVRQAHGRAATFKPGFGCTISDAVQASCSAVPFFEKKVVITAQGDEIELIDGGFCANNPALYALAEAVAALGYAPENCRLLSLGCGNYPEPKPGLKMYLAKRYLISVQLLQKTLSINTESMDQLRRILFKHVPTVRISDTFDKPEMATDLFEHDLKRLSMLHQRGSESFGRYEADIHALLTNDS